MSSAGYARITAVSADGGNNYVITYVTVTRDDILDSVDLYDTKPVDGKEFLADTDVAALEEQIEVQAMESGFADRRLNT